jgi:phospholipid-transporting ATPase
MGKPEQAETTAVREIILESRTGSGSRKYLSAIFNRQYKTNKISTNKYTIVTFLPVCLFLQFKRYANIYFLVTAVLQSLPYVSPLSPLTAILPLIFVLGVTMIREAYEDYNRYKNDTKLNETKCSVFDMGQWIESTWADIHVGDYIRVTEGDVIPADMCILYTGISGSQRGVCFIETGSLDGEKSLKQKLALVPLMDKIDNEKLENLRGKIVVNKPNTNIHSLDGKIEWDDKSLILSAKQLVMRGAFLRNTEYIIGVAVYTGPDTKIMLNSAQSRFKVTLMEENMNQLIVLLLVLQFALIVCSIVGYVLWNNLYYDNYRSLFTFKLSRFVESLLMFFSYFLIYNTLLPISLMVTIDIAKLCQTYFIGEDFEMYNKEKDKGCKVMSKSINEELGQIEYVFTDKTGTLTCNVMVLKYLVIGEQQYSGTLTRKTDVNSRFAREGDFYAQPLYDLITGRLPDTPIPNGPTVMGTRITSQAKLVDEFMMLLSTCHDCVVHMQNQSEREVIT